MNRRDSLGALLSIGVAIGPLGARAQKTAKTPARIGFLSNYSPETGKSFNDCFRKGLRDLDWIEGKNITIEYRWAEGIADRFPVLAADIVNLRPDLIVVQSTPGSQAVQRATRAIPVVMIAVSDPVASGIVASLSRPGGNITGVSNNLPETTRKFLELLRMVAPNMSRVGVLHNPSNPGKVLEAREVQMAGQRLTIAVEGLEVRSSDDFERAFSRCTQLRCDALITLQDGVTLGNRSRVTGFAEVNRLPAIYQVREFVEAGGLMSYGVDFCDHFRRAATYVDKILKGAQPRDLPVEQPMTFELSINLKAARAIGLKVPQSLLIMANEVIE